jgi:ubiquinone/menaquinone biosynthesis C-methylase UbiE
MFLRPTEIIENLIDKKIILKGMKGADFGCGTGYFTALLSKAVSTEGTIYAIDVDEEVLEQAKDFISHFGLLNVKFLLKNLEISSGLDNNSLDFIFISQLIYQLEDPRSVIKEAYRVLKNNGHLIVLESQESNILFSGQKVCKPQEITLFLEENNFKIIEIDQNINYFLIISQK